MMYEAHVVLWDYGPTVDKELTKDIHEEFCKDHISFDNNQF